MAGHDRVCVLMMIPEPNRNTLGPADRYELGVVQSNLRSAGVCRERGGARPRAARWPRARGRRAPHLPRTGRAASAAGLYTTRACDEEAVDRSLPVEKGNPA